MPPARDTTLDTCRALIMIYIVCVIHVIYWLNLGTELVRSALLFEMPVVFFIAGASQRLVKKEKSIFDTVVNRFRRVVLPFYVFLGVLFAALAAYTAVHPECFHTFFNPRHVVKILCTGGSDVIPFYGYTWFISVYFIISCSLPIQKKLLARIPAPAYLLLIAAVVAVLSPFHFAGETAVKHIPVYNFFYVAGYAFYRRCSRRLLYLTAVATTLPVIVCFADGTMLPMQSHKFPADFLFLLFGTAALSLLSIITKMIESLRHRIAAIPDKSEIRSNRGAAHPHPTNRNANLFRRITTPPARLCHYIIDIWNKRGYTIYLYQTITYIVADYILHRYTNALTGDTAIFMAYAVAVFIISTVISPSPTLPKGREKPHPASPKGR